MESKIYMVEVCYPLGDGDFLDSNAYCSRSAAEKRAERIKLMLDDEVDPAGTPQVIELVLKGQMVVLDRIVVGAVMDEFAITNPYTEEGSTNE